MAINKNVLKFLLLCFGLLFALWVVGYFYNVDILLIILFFLLLIIACKLNVNFLIKYMFMIVMFSYHVISVYMVENNNIYFYNLMQSSKYTGALFPLLMYYMLFFATLLILEVRKVKKGEKVYQKFHFKFSTHKITEKTKVNIFTIVLIVIVLYMVYRMKSIGFYSLGGINRFDFRETYFTGFDEKFYTYILWFLPIPLLASNIKMKGRSFLFFILYLLYLIFVGDKFGSFFIAIYFYFLVTWTTKNINKKKVYRFLFILGGIAILLVGFIAFQVLYERGSWNEVLIYFRNRLTGGQSDLWWAIYNSEKNSSWHVIEFFNDEISAIFNQPQDIMFYNFGIYKMMKLAAPASVVNTYLSQGIRFAASTQASLFYYFKYTGLICGAIIFGLLTYFFVNKAVESYKNNDIIRSILYTMFISKLIQVMTMSDITMVGNFTTILGFLILFAFYFFQKQQKIRRNRGVLVNGK